MDHRHILPHPASRQAAASPVIRPAVPENDSQAQEPAEGDLLAFTPPSKPNAQWMNVREVVDQVCAQYRPRTTAAGIDVTLDVPRELLLLADRQMVRTAISNLVVNAVEAMHDGGQLDVTLCQGRHGLELEVADSGPGLSAEVRRHAFDASFTTKPNAAGMGLAMVRRIVEAHGGDVVATNCPEGGAAFTLRFPRRATQAAA